ncbi:RICIN domain-containing protein [Amycolatopsis sp. CA-128772]|uniref:RICIN domain-containing protein n=1 Tax=Amycolatopsis sp. CA-128772 TaxID=2073159 RepID=UPI001304FDFA|nr:RICIN domain-containing protein [Amycolatopsis sp. CA-128772]
MSWVAGIGALAVAVLALPVPSLRTQGGSLPAPRGFRAQLKGVKMSKNSPLLLVNRACGFALDTPIGTEPGGDVTVWTPHGQQHQLWRLEASGEKNQVLIVSVANGLVLDATFEVSGDIHPVMSENTGQPRQRWRLEDSPDGNGYLIRSVHNGRYLTIGHDAARGWGPWFEDRHSRSSQQWMLLLPQGRMAEVG